MLYEVAFSPIVTSMDLRRCYAFETEVADDRTMVDVVHIIKNYRCSMFNYL